MMNDDHNNDNINNNGPISHQLRLLSFIIRSIHSATATRTMRTKAKKRHRDSEKERELDSTVTHSYRVVN